MKQLQHTPGPWRFTGTRMGGDASVVSEDRLIASVHPRRLRAPFEEDNAERDANARLIAAAPDMLAVCRDALTFIQEEAENRSEAGSEYSDYEREPRELVERLEAVIAAAEGRADA